MLRTENLDIDYILLYDAYYGVGGFRPNRAGKNIYLEKYIRESDEKYLRRKHLAYYINYFKPIVRSHVDPIFRKSPSRNYSNDLTGEFLKNVDGAKSDMNKFMIRGANIAQIYGSAWVVTDNFPEVPTKMSDVVANRIYPYVSVYPPSRINDYTVNRFGILTSITFKEPAENENGDIQIEEYNLRKWTLTSWTLTDTNGAEISRGDHNLERLPVTVIYSNEVDRLDVIPVSDYMDVARISKAMYNRCSELEEILTGQTFNILTYPVSRNQELAKIKETIGSVENVLGFDGESSSRPAFIAPSPDSAEMQQKQLAWLVQEMYRIARLSHVVGTEQKTSGVAKAFDFEQTNSSLSSFAKTLERAEEDIISIFCKWQGIEEKDYSVSYGNDFGIIDVSGMLADATAALEAKIGSKFDVAVRKYVASAYLQGNSTPEEIQEIKDDIESEAENDVYNEQTMETKTGEQVKLTGE